MPESLQAVDFWDRLRAARNTPDRETFQQGGYFGLAGKLGATMASLPMDLIDLVKSTPQLAALLGGASQPAGMLERGQLGQMVMDVGKTALENPVTTAASFASPSGAYNVAREATYATLGAKLPHAMMYLRSILPWYEGKPWTRVPKGVEETIQRTGGAAVRSGLHGSDAARNVADKLRGYLESIGEAPIRAPGSAWLGEGPGYEVPRLQYGVPVGLEEVVGGAFLERSPKELRILDDLRWYLDTDPPEGGGRGWTSTGQLAPYKPDELSELLQKIYDNPKLLGEIWQKLTSPGTMTGIAKDRTVEKMGELSRMRLRDTLELYAKRHGISFPIDWRIPVDDTPPPVHEVDFYQ